MGISPFSSTEQGINRGTDDAANISRRSWYGHKANHHTRSLEGPSFIIILPVPSGFLQAVTSTAYCPTNSMEQTPPWELNSRSLNHSRNYPPFMKLESSWLCSQDPITVPCPEADEFGPYQPFYFKTYSNIVLRSTPWYSKFSLLFRFPDQNIVIFVLNSLTYPSLLTL
jgi:hypothetical protein